MPDMKPLADSMPSVDRFLQVVVKSGLIGREELKQLPAAVTIDAGTLADHLVTTQRLTQFQADKLLRGTWQGLVLGPYQILAPLGRGGMGAVYLARNKNAGELQPALVALKVLPPRRAREEERTLARFRREIEMNRIVSHPHLTRTFAAGEIDGVYYIAMEYIRGHSLSQLVKAEGPLSVERAARLFAEVAEGIARAHEKGLIHRDLKPSNIMVTPNGHAKILDLGLAFLVDEELPADKQIVGGQGYVLGTMDYIAPEQVDDPTRVDARADLYALGCSLYFAVTGQPPFPGGTSKAKMQKQRTAYAEPIPDLNPTVPIEFARIVEKLMEKSPARRYRSGTAVREMLLRWAGGEAELPLDVDPMMSEVEAVRQLEQELAAQPHPWWESVPVVSFEATAKYGQHVERAEEKAPRPQTSNHALWALAIAGGLVLLVLLLDLLRR